MNGQHGYHMNLLAQNYGFAMFSHPHFTYTATPSIHQSLDASPNEHEYQSYDEGLSSQGHIESGHRQYEIREDEDNFDLCNDVHAQICDESSEKDEPSEDDGESETLESESDEDTNDSEDLPQNDIGVNLHNQFGQNVISKVHEIFGHQVTYRKAWLGRQRAFKLVYSDFQKSFSELPKFFTAFQHFNHGTIVEWKHEESMIISVDGTHLYGKYEIKLLIVVGIDGNDNILPLAFAIVDRESKEAWKCFFRKLSAHEPRAFHQFCVRHLKSSFQSYFSNKNLSDLMWNAASAHQVRKFEALMWEIREENEEVYEYLMQFPLEKWTISHNDGKKLGVLTTNLSESFNGLLKKARGLPIIAMVTERMGGLARNFVSEHFTIENYVATCFGSFSPVGHEAYWPSPSFIMRSNEFYRHPNRQRTTRVPNEINRGPAVYGRAYGLCRQT
ncbi:hypothetical protein P3S67_023070 [Capsicum chacoense]